MALTVAFVGAHGVGKTTLLESVRSRLWLESVSTSATKELPRVICEIVNDPSFFRRGNNSLTKQLLIIFSHTSSEYTSFRQNQMVALTDRTVLDHWAYTVDSFEDELISSGCLQPFIEMIRRHLASYDLIFFIPAEFKPQDDGTREDDEQFQIRIQELMRKMLVEWSIPHFEIRGTLDNRSDKVCARIKEALNGS